MAYETKPVWSTVSLGTPTMPGPRVSDTIDEFLQAVDAGTARDRHGRPFARESARDLHRSLESYIGSELGGRRLNYVRRQHLEALLDGLESAGVPPLRLAAPGHSLRALYDYAPSTISCGTTPRRAWTSATSRRRPRQSPRSSTGRSR